MPPKNCNQLSESSNDKINQLDASSLLQLKLKDKISLFNGCAIIIGVIIGSGIFISPKGVLLNTGNVLLSIIIWTLCGLYATTGALCYSELGTTIPKSGGDYAYISTAFGPLFGFLFLWVSFIIVNPTSNAIISLAFAKYLLKPFFEYCEVPYYSERLLAGWIILILTFINCYNVRWSTRTQDAAMLTKILATSSVIFGGIYYVFTNDEHHINVENFTDNLKFDFIQISLSFYSGVFSFSGWNYLNFVTEEIKDPQRNLPLAIFISLPTVTIIYILVNLAYFAVLSPEEILSSDAVAVSFAAKIVGPAAAIITPLVACCCMGTLNGIIFASSRMFFAGARDGNLPELLAMINIQYLTPMPSILMLAILSLAMLLIKDIFVLINYLAFTEASIVAMSIASLIYLRFTQPNLYRPIKLNICIPIAYFCMLAYILTVPLVINGATELYVALAVISSGLPCYYLFVYSKKNSSYLYKIWVQFTQFIQKLTICVGEDDCCQKLVD